jgi:dolichol-phosphate mannosyltransferase
MWGRISDPSKPSEARQRLVRWVKFNLVGGIGIGVQLVALAIFRSLLHFNYLLATVLAVEVTVIHNFLWHEHFTWADRPSGHVRHSIARLARFNATNGLVSLVANLVLMRLLVGGFGMNYVAANVIAITACSLVNFMLSDSLVFSSESKT